MTPAAALARLGHAARGAPVALPGGPVSQSWRVELVGAGPAVLRIDRRRGGRTLAAALGLDRAVEHRWLAALAPAGLAPAPIAIDPAAGVALRAWLPGTPGAGRRPARLVGPLAAALARLHRHPVPAGLAAPRDWRATLARYARLAGPAGEGAAVDAHIRLLEADRGDSSLGEIGDSLLLEIGDSLLRPPTGPGPVGAEVNCPQFPKVNCPQFPPVNCHHDPGPGNFVAGAGRFLDWEYAAVGNPLFDLAVAGQGLGLTRGRDWARLAAAYAAAGGVVAAPVAAGSLPAWAAFATAVGRLWSAAVTGWSCS